MDGWMAAWMDGRMDGQITVVLTLEKQSYPLGDLAFFGGSIHFKVPHRGVDA